MDKVKREKINKEKLTFFSIFSRLSTAQNNASTTIRATNIALDCVDWFIATVPTPVGPGAKTTLENN